MYRPQQPWWTLRGAWGPSHVDVQHQQPSPPPERSQILSSKRCSRSIKCSGPYFLMRTDDSLFLKLISRVSSPPSSCERGHQATGGVRSNLKKILASPPPCPRPLFFMELQNNGVVRWRLITLEHDHPSIVLLLRPSIRDRETGGHAFGAVHTTASTTRSSVSWPTCVVRGWDRRR